jgi:hypothetical protein
MMEFIYGFITGMAWLTSIAVLDVAIFKNKMINKKVNDWRVYLFATFIETICFLMGFFIGGLK